MVSNSYISSNSYVIYKWERVYRACVAKQDRNRFIPIRNQPLSIANQYYPVLLDHFIRNRFGFNCLRMWYKPKPVWLLGILQLQAVYLLLLYSLFGGFQCKFEYTSQTYNAHLIGMP